MKGKIIIKILDANGNANYEEFSPSDLVDLLTYDDPDDGCDLDTLGYLMNDAEAFDKTMEDWEAEDMTLVEIIERYLAYAEDGINGNLAD